LFLAVVAVERNGRTRGMRREANIVCNYVELKCLLEDLE
jgi:hypothetical protein